METFVPTFRPNPRLQSLVTPELGHEYVFIKSSAPFTPQERPLTLFHRPRFDVSKFRYLAIRAKKTDDKQYFVNLQADSIFPQYLWQHRLAFQKHGEWETLIVPFRDFTLTAYGFTQKNQVSLPLNKIKSIGFSTLRQPGAFSLELEWIKAVNTERTFGEYDILEKNEYIDEQGEVKKLPAGQSLKDMYGQKFKLFPTNEEEKKWF